MKSVLDGWITIPDDYQGSFDGKAGRSELKIMIVSAQNIDFAASKDVTGETEPPYVFHASSDQEIDDLWKEIHKVDESMGREDSQFLYSISRPCKNGTPQVDLEKPWYVSQ